MQKWEYMQITESTHGLGAGVFIRFPSGESKKYGGGFNVQKNALIALNFYGDLGWEAVGLATEGVSIAPAKYWLLKRPKQE